MNFSNKFIYTLIFLTIFSINRSAAQFYTAGNEPTNIKWRSLKSGSFRIIYPEQADSLARVFAARLEKDLPLVSFDGVNVRKPFPVLLHPYNVFYNGLVVWAPKRSELNIMAPGYGSYAQSWEKQLSLHELRHLSQMSVFNRGFFKFLSLLMGEQYAGLGVGLYSSKWELEGDAVISETKFSNSGRGRDPEFINFYKASFLSGDKRNWTRWALGSENEYEPDHYSLGWLFLSELEKRYGKDLFLKVLLYRLRHPLDLNGSNNSYKSITGVKSKPKLFKLIADDLTLKWKKEDEQNSPYGYHIKLVEKENVYRSFSSPVVLDNGKVAVVMESPGLTSSIGLLDSAGKFIRLAATGVLSSKITTDGKFLYWSESRPSARWEQVGKSSIVKFNPDNGKRIYLTKRGVYYNPCPENGDSLYVVEYLPDGKTQIVILSSFDGSVAGKLEFNKGGQIKEIAVNGESIGFTLVRDSTIQLMWRGKPSQDFISIVSCSGNNIRNIRFWEESILFDSDLSGKFECYVVKPSTKEVYKITNSRFGASFPVTFGEKQLIWVDFSNEGYLPVKGNIALVPEKSFPQSVPDGVYIPQFSSAPSEKYSKLLNAFNIHSWAPLYYDVDEILSESMTINDIPVKPGLVLMSQNLLGTTVAMAGVSYENSRAAGHFSLKYRGFYPVFELKADVNSRDAYNYDFVYDNQERIVVKKSNAGRVFVNGRLRSYIPFNLSGGGRKRGFIPAVAWSFKNDRFTDNLNSKNTLYNQFYVTLQYYDYLIPAKRRFFPENGFGLNVRYSTVPGSGRYFGPLLGVQGYFYLPGILYSHGIKMNLNAQWQYINGKKFYQDNFFQFVRGFDDVFAKRTLSFSFNYVAPIYVNQPFGHEILYLRRLRVMPFADAAFLEKSHIGNSIYSFGTDIVADLNFLGISFPFSTGIRILRKSDNTSEIGFLFNMSL